MAAGDLTTVPIVKQWLGLSGLGVAAITKANPAVLTLASVPNTPLLSGGTYTVEGVMGLTSIPNGDYIITKLSNTTFSIPVDTTMDAVAYVANSAIVGVIDSLIARLISAASTYIQRMISCNIAQATYTEQRNGVGGSRMMTKQVPVTNVAAVSVNGYQVPVRPALGPGSTSNPGGFVFDDVSVMLTGYEFCRGMQNVSLTYTAGYATTPADIEQACVVMIGEWFRYRDRIGKLSEGIEGQTISFTNAQVPSQAQGIINTYNTRYPVS